MSDDSQRRRAAWKSGDEPVPPPPPPPDEPLGLSDAPQEPNELPPADQTDDVRWWVRIWAGLKRFFKAMSEPIGTSRLSAEWNREDIADQKSEPNQAQESEEEESEHFEPVQLDAKQILSIHEKLDWIAQAVVDAQKQALHATNSAEKAYGCTVTICWMLLLLICMVIGGCHMIDALPPRYY